MQQVNGDRQDGLAKSQALSRDVHDSAAKTAASNTRLPRAVIADDDPAMLELLDALVSISSVASVVGRARDGREAVDLVLAHNPEIALLDVDMPRLRGTQAAEVIRTYRPHTQVILHTANLEPSLREEALAIGVPLLDKMAAAERLENVLREIAATADGEVPRPIDSLVLLALERRPDEATLMINAEHEVLFYDHVIAQILGLPFPPEQMPLSQFRRNFTQIDVDGASQPLAQRPTLQALETHKDVEGVVYERLGDDVLKIHSRARVIHADDGAFLGIVAYWRVLKQTPS